MKSQLLQPELFRLCPDAVLTAYRAMLAKLPHRPLSYGVSVLYRLEPRGIGIVRGQGVDPALVEWTAPPYAEPFYSVEPAADLYSFGRNLHTREKPRKRR